MLLKSLKNEINNEVNIIRGPISISKENAKRKNFQIKLNKI